MWATILIEHPLPAFRWVAVLLAALAAAAAEARWRGVPSWMTWPLLATGLGAALAAGGLPGLLDAAAGGLLCGAVTAVFAYLAGGQAGAAKLTAGLGTWLGLAWGGGLLIAVALAGSLLGGLQQGLALRLETALGGPVAPLDGGRTPSSIPSVLLGTWLLAGAACLWFLALA